MEHRTFVVGTGEYWKGVAVAPSQTGTIHDGLIMYKPADNEGMYAYRLSDIASIRYCKVGGLFSKVRWLDIEIKGIGVLYLFASIDCLNFLESGGASIFAMGPRESAVSLAYLNGVTKKNPHFIHALGKLFKGDFGSIAY